MTNHFFLPQQTAAESINADFPTTLAFNKITKIAPIATSNKPTTIHALGYSGQVALSCGKASEENPTPLAPHRILAAVLRLAEHSQADADDAMKHMDELTLDRTGLFGVLMKFLALNSQLQNLNDPISNNELLRKFIAVVSTSWPHAMYHIKVVATIALNKFRSDGTDISELAPLVQALDKSYEWTLPNLCSGQHTYSATGLELYKSWKAAKDLPGNMQGLARGQAKYAQANAARRPVAQHDHEVPDPDAVERVSFRQF